MCDIGVSCEGCPPAFKIQGIDIQGNVNAKIQDNSKTVIQDNVKTKSQDKVKNNIQESKAFDELATSMHELATATACMETTSGIAAPSADKFGGADSVTDSSSESSADSGTEDSCEAKHSGCSHHHLTLSDIKAALRLALDRH